MRLILPILVMVLASGALVIGAWYSSTARQMLSEAQQRYQHTQTLVARTDTSRSALKQFSDVTREFVRWQPQIEQQALRASSWNERQITLQNRLLSRAQVDAYLLSTAPRRDSFFVVQDLHIRAAGGERGLFVDYRDDDRANALAFTLRGTFYSR